jgi:hypothetical protein
MEMLVQESCGQRLPELIAEAVDLVVHLERGAKLTGLMEVWGHEDGRPADWRGNDEESLVHGGGDRAHLGVRQGCYVVDRLFDRAVLISGVGRRQQRILIERKVEDR